MNNLTRRSFLLGTASLSTLAVACPLTAIDPIQRSANNRMPLSLSTYSMNSYFNPKTKEQANKRLTLTGFVDWAAGLNLDGIELTSYFFPHPVKPDYLARLKRRCYINGLDITGGAIGNNFSLPEGKQIQHQFKYTRKWIRHYAKLGAPVIRIFAGHPTSGTSEKEAIQRAINNINQISEYAGQHGIILALENHDFLKNADRMMPIIKGVQSQWFGVNLDTGNFRSEAPYEDMKAVAPYAVNVQLKTNVHIKGQGTRPADLERIIAILRNANYSGPIVLEYEGETDPYQAIPNYLDKIRTILRRG